MIRNLCKGLLLMTAGYVLQRIGRWMQGERRAQPPTMQPIPAPPLKRYENYVVLYTSPEADAYGRYDLETDRELN